MSLFTTSSSLLTLRPRVTEAPPCLILATGRLPALLTLGLGLKKVSIDTSTREITFHTRTAWLFASSYTLGFDDLHYLDYAFNSFGTSWGWSLEGLGRQDQVESFSLSVFDKEGHKHLICIYRGEGAVQTGWSGILLGDDALWDASGTQESESRRMANYLKQLLNLPLGKPITESIPMSTCPHCDRPVADYAVKCIYCAKEITRDG